ncbi:MAG: hypothetical protein V4709_00315 [Pseudomonadota bacterium]
MNTTQRLSPRRIPPFHSLWLALIAGWGVVSMSPALAQSSKAIPKIAEFYVDADEQLEVGSALNFTLEGTAGGNASVRISGIKARIPLKETEPGVYEGRYTVKAVDRITSGTTARATLQRRNRSSSVLLGEPLGVTLNAVLPLATPSQPGVLAIDSLVVTPLDKLEAGADLDFTMVASPGGQASVSIEGIANPIVLREVRSGTYTGSYTVRRSDRISSSARVTGSLVASGRTLRIPLNQSLIRSVARPVIANLLPANGTQLTSGTAVSVSGTFDDSSGTGVDPTSVVLQLGGRDVTRSAVVTPQFFNYRADLEAGSYTGVVTARDRVGNSLRQSWQFTVLSSASTASNVPLPLELTSHQNQGQVVAGQIQLRGRTAPGATIDAQVTAVSAIFGLLGLSQNLLTQSTQADANGNFLIGFNAPPMKQGGGRLQITLTASKGSQRQVQNLVLNQSQ